MLDISLDIKMIKVLQKKKKRSVKYQNFHLSKVIQFIVAIGAVHDYVDKVEAHHWQTYLHSLNS